MSCSSGPMTMWHGRLRVIRCPASFGFCFSCHSNSPATPTHHRRRTGQGPCHANLREWGLAQSPSCDCGQRQTVNHIVGTCPLTKFEAGLNLLHEADDDAVILAGIYSDCSTREIIIIIVGHSAGQLSPC